MSNPKSTNPNRVQYITTALWNNHIADLGAGWSISEVYGSDDISNGVPTKKYLSEGNPNSFEVYGAILALSPYGFLDGVHYYYRDKPSVTVVSNTTDAFNITVNYKENNEDNEDQEPGEPWSRTVNVSVSLEQEHRQISLETVSSAGKQASQSSAADPAPNFGKGVNVTPNALEGYDVGVPRITISFDVEVPSLTDAQIKAMYDEVGTVCNAGIFGRDKGEVLYTNFSYNKTAYHKASLHFEFQVRKNEQNIQTPNGLAPIANKEGWQYLWFYMLDETDTTTNTTVTKPVAWFIERVYEYNAWTNSKAITGTTLDVDNITSNVGNNNQ